MSDIKYKTMTSGVNSSSHLNIVDLKAASSPISGKFIVIEGIDGSGKSTQAKLLAERLHALFTYEPTNLPIGALCRSAIRGEIDLSRSALSLMLVADRLEHLKSLIMPAISSGKTVVCDRYYLSNMAYQAGHSLSISDIYALNKSHVIPAPDLTVYLKITPELALSRTTSRRGETSVFENLQSLKSIERAYQEALIFVQAEGEYVISVEANEERELITEQILSQVLKFFHT